MGVKRLMSAELSIRVADLGKCYQIYDRPRDRLMQMLVRGRRRYYREFWALSGVSLDVPKGEALGIIGRNGSGKSTLLQLVSGVLSPSTGTIETRGRLAALLELGSGFNGDLTGRENVFLNGAILGLERDEIDGRFAEIADFAGIGDFIEQPVRTYSSGMLVRLAFAVSACVEPDILVIDEALAVGDAAFQFKCLDRLRRLAARGTTLLFVSHDMGMIKNFCNQALYLAGGKVRHRGPPDEVSEMYFMDLRDEQRQLASGQPRLRLKPFLGAGQGMAFGTDEGAIIAAEFCGTGAMQSTCMRGETVELEVTVRFASTVAAPSLSVSVQDKRMINLGGHFFALTPGAAGEDDVVRVVRVAFAARFLAGRYFITLRLENRPAPRTFDVIDRQPGVLALEVMEVEPAFLGPVDLDMRLSAQRAGTLS
ncbi:MAG: ATP-binding cassette domain-containing protein [Burkholderiales bacterium]|nr:ATP-binding cassette domain-containing protein [Burkholderiales bacterium]